MVYCRTGMIPHNFGYNSLILMSTYILNCSTYMYKYSSYRFDNISGFGAAVFCENEHGSLLRLTGNAIYDIKREFVNGGSDLEQVSLWTNLLVSREHFTKDKIYSGNLPIEYDEIVANEKQLCVYATISLLTEYITWAPTDCEKNLTDAFIFCLHYDEGAERWCSTLLPEKRKWEEANDYCLSKGAKLDEVNDGNTFERKLQKLFHLSIWKELSINSFWIGQKTRMHSVSSKPLSALTENQKAGGTNCVAIIAQFHGSGYLDLMWANKNCDDKELFSCVSRMDIDGVYFIRLNSTFWPLFHLKDDGLPYSIERCKLEVIKLNENGIMCGGFNYNKVNSSCTFFGHSFYYYVAILNNPTFDTFLMSETVGDFGYSDTQNNTLQCQKQELALVYPTILRENEFTAENYVEMSQPSFKIYNNNGLYTFTVMVLVSTVASFTSIIVILAKLVGAAFHSEQDHENLENEECEESESDKALDNTDLFVTTGNVYRNIPPPWFLIPVNSVPGAQRKK